MTSPSPTAVADTSALVSLGCAVDFVPSPLALLFDEYELLVPLIVVDELTEIASYDDRHGEAATTSLKQIKEHEATTPVESDVDLPLDEGERDAITLANEEDAVLFLCDEFTNRGLIDAALSGPRLSTTPTWLLALVRADLLSRSDARTIVDVIADTRSWEGNSYYRRVRPRFDDD